MDSKPLIIPESKRWTGLKVYCYECGTTVYDICRKTGKPIAQCKNGERHIYKVYVHIPGTKKQRRTKALDTRDLNEAIKQAIEFAKEVKSGEYQSPKEKKQQTKIKKEDQGQNKPYLLLHALARYIGWLNNEGVPAHLMKVRSREHIKDVERALKGLAECLSESGYNLNSLTVDDINNELVGRVFDYLEKRKLAPRTFNKLLTYYTSFLKWYTAEYDYPIRNYFERVRRKNLNPKPEAITFKEYTALLEKVKPENGIKEYSDGVKPIRNLYRPWLADGFRLALETGRRREEIINMKWNNIRESDDIPYIIVEDFKVNRIQNRISEEEKKFIHIPITESLEKLLKDLDLEDYVGTDNYILAPGITISRKRVMADTLSRGFSHYYKQLNTGKRLTFKCLRKTYITNLEIFMGRGNTKSITGHSDDQVIEQNYIDKKEIAKAARGFKVFPNEHERGHELKEIRKEQQRDKEPERSGI